MRIFSVHLSKMMNLLWVIYGSRRVANAMRRTNFTSRNSIYRTTEVGVYFHSPLVEHVKSTDGPISTIPSHPMLRYARQPNNLKRRFPSHIALCQKHLIL